MRAAKFRLTVCPVIASPALRRLLPAFGVSAVGDGMSAVGLAWLAIRIASPAHRGLLVGLAVASYTLPGAAGAVLLARPLRALTLPYWSTVQVTTMYVRPAWRPVPSLRFRSRRNGAAGDGRPDGERP